MSKTKKKHGFDNKILFVIPDLEAGGSERQLVNIANHLKEKSSHKITKELSFKFNKILEIFFGRTFPGNIPGAIETELLLDIILLFIKSCRTFSPTTIEKSVTKDRILSTKM